MGGDKFRDEFSLAFDGTNDYVNCGSDSSIDNIFDGGGTIAGWIKVASDGGGSFGRIIDKSSAGNGSGGWTLTVEDEGLGSIDLNLMVGHSTTYGRWTTTAREITLNAWTHFALVYDDDSTSNEPIFYINGVSVGISKIGDGPAGTKADDSSLDLLIAASGLANREFDGSISEIAMYDTELTASQVRTLYNGREPYNHKEGIASGNLKAWWRMGDGRFDGFASEGIWGGTSGLITDEVNPTKGSDLFDSGVGDYSSSIGAWSAEGTNDVDIDSGAVKITYVNDSDGARLNLNNAADLTTDLTVGKVYELKFASKINTGSSVTVQVNDGSGTFKNFTINQTDWMWKKHFFHCKHATNCQIKLSGFSTGEELWIKNVRLAEFGDNAGVLTNMAEGDIVGDTP
tara:strand:- start:283 stop:1482 length:1200 start_codon:yes stop_codon:yes gene_type:complete